MSVVFNTTRVFEECLKLYLANERLILSVGGSRSGKSHSIIQLLIIIGLHATKKTLISVVSESIPHLKRGIIRTFKDVMGDQWDEKNFNKSELIYKLTENTIIEFFSCDQPAKLRGSGRDILFCNEVNGITKTAFDELTIRTKQTIFCDWNPWRPFFINQYKTTTNFVHSTYLDNPYLPKALVEDLESKKKDANFFRVMGLGLEGAAEGTVFPDFKIIKASEFPYSDGKYGYGADFGYSDPSTLTACDIKDKKLYLDQKIYKSGLTNSALAIEYDLVGVRKYHDEIIADCASPGAIKELQDYGFNVKPCLKDKDSVINGLRKMLEFDICVTEESVDIIKELRSLLFVEIAEDESGQKRYSNKTCGPDHSIDGARYWVYDKYHDRHLDYAGAFSHFDDDI